MKLVNNILLILLFVLVVFFWKNDYEFKYEEDYTDYIYRGVLISILVMIALNNLMPTYKKY